MASSTHSNKKIASSTPLNNDVLIEIFSLPPVQSLLLLRAVCKSWRDVIDSPSFRKLHNDNNNNGDDVTVYLKFTFSNSQEPKLSVKLLHNGEKLLKSYSDKFDNEVSTFLELMNGEYEKPYDHHCVRLVGPVKGLVCIYSLRQIEIPIALCNPFLGQLKILPNMTSSSSNSCRIHSRDVAIGFTGEDYKVVQLLSCYDHPGFHAQLYSTKANSWRELVLDDDQCMVVLKPIKSSSWCNIAHWHGFRYGDRHGGSDCLKSLILCLDMENEVFRTITISNSNYTGILGRGGNSYEIFAENEHSFLLFVRSDDSLTKMYESRCEGGELSWIHMRNVEETSHGGIISTPPPLTHCVVLKNNSVGINKSLKRKELIVYDYRARKFIGWFELPERSEVVECKGSFVSILS